MLGFERLNDFGVQVQSYLVSERIDHCKMVTVLRHRVLGRRSDRDDSSRLHHSANTAGVLSTDYEDVLMYQRSGSGQ